jgi:predicted nucleic acid-binding protein
MTIGAGNKLFLDTNVLVYANVAETPLHLLALQTIENYYQAGVDLWISRQILREFLATVTRPQNYASPQPIATIVTRVQDFQQLFNMAWRKIALM